MNVMKRTARIVSLILALIMVVGVFASCSTTTQGTKEPGTLDNTQPTTEEETITSIPIVEIPDNFVIPEGGYDGSEVEIVFDHTMGQNLREVLDPYIAEFNKLYPNIKITHSQVGGYDDVRDQISKEISVGNHPSMAYCYPDHVALYNIAKVVAHLDVLASSQIEVTRADGTKEILGFTEEQKADFIESYYNEGSQFGDNHMYTLPFSKSTEVLYYDKTFFEANNLSVPKTWDELEALCEEIIKIDENCIPLGIDSEANWFITLCEQYGSPYTSAVGNHYRFNNATNRTFVKNFREWYLSGYLTTQTILGSYTSGLFVSTDKTRSYMSIGSSAGATHQRPERVDGKYPFEVGIAPIPQVDPEKPKAISQGPSLCIFLRKDKEGNVTNTQEVIASWLFAKFLTTNVEFQAEFSMVSGYVPVIKSVKDNEVYAQFLSRADGYEYIAALSAKVCLEQENSYYTSPAFNGSSTARDQVGSLFTACLTNVSSSNIDADIEKAFKEAISKCEFKGD